ncbi:histidinol-phosphate transaminase [Virgibacillus sp. W0181]|uniref:histidinol-phosphate transaminase n=1 Tax=Virgibacillus sp. W0181 TaxID=3391581 RepID=UPI003F45FD2E
MEAKAILKEMAPYRQGMQIDEVKKKFNLTRIVKLASNENPYGYSEKVKAALRKLDLSFEIYPDGHATHLRTATSKKWDIKESEIVFGSGSDELIEIICRTFLHEGLNTVMAAPTFPQYRHHALIEGALVKEVPTIEGNHDLDGMLQAIDENTKVVWLCSPDNPTGTLIPPQAFHQFMENCPTNVVVVLDEAYYEFIDGSLQMDASANIQRYSNLIILRTFSKAYGLAGLRVGYGIANEKITEKINVVRGPFNTSILAQKAASIAIEDDLFIQETVESNEVVKQKFQQFLTSIGWHFYPSQTNFLLVSTPGDADELADYLLENGFIVRSGNLLGYPHTVRITIGTKQDMTQLQQVIKQFQLLLDKEV